MSTWVGRGQDARLMAEGWLRNVQHIRAALQRAGLPISWLDGQTAKAKRITCKCRLERAICDDCRGSVNAEFHCEPVQP